MFKQARRVIILVFEADVGYRQSHSVGEIFDGFPESEMVEFHHECNGGPTRSTAKAMIELF